MASVAVRTWLSATGLEMAAYGPEQTLLLSQPTSATDPLQAFFLPLIYSKATARAAVAARARATSDNGETSGEIVLACYKASTQFTQPLLERAIALDPGYCEAHWRLAMALIHNWLHWGEPEEPNRPNAIALAQRAVELDPNDSGAHLALGQILLYECRWDEAEVHYETAIRLNPNNADALAVLADFKTLIGKPQQGVQSAERALRFNPHPPHWYYWGLGFAQFANGQYEDAVRTLRREETYRTATRRILAAALAVLGRVSEAREEAKLFLLTSPHWRISKWVESQPFKNPQDGQVWIDAYRLAGFPD